MVVVPLIPPVTGPADVYRRRGWLGGGGVIGSGGILKQSCRSRPFFTIPAPASTLTPTFTHPMFS